MGEGGGTLNELLERENEIAEMDSALKTAAQGHGALLLVEGPAGIGKSTLLQAAAKRADGFTVRLAAGCELETELPFGVATALVGDPTVDPESAPGPDRGFALVQDLFRVVLDSTFPAGAAEPVPLLLLVDDAQWSDPASLRFLDFLARRLSDLPVLLVVAARDGDPGQVVDLLEAVRATPHTRVLKLAPLSRAGVGTVVRDTVPAADDDLVHACARASGGNPFYLGELVRELASGGRTSVDAVAEAAPESLLRALLVRLARLGPGPTALAKAGAVLSDDVALAVAAELTDLGTTASEDAADALAAAGFLAPGEPLRFAHPLIASTLRRDIGSFARARAHRRAADVLERSGAGADQVAAHLLRTRPLGDATTVERLRRGAAVAHSRGEPATAAKLLQRGLDEPPPQELRAAVLIDLAEAEAIRGAPVAVQRLEEAVDAIDAPRERARVLYTLSRLIHLSGDHGRSAELALRGHRELPAGDPMADRLTAAFLSPAMLHPPLRTELEHRLGPLIEAAGRGDYPDDPALRAHLAVHLATMGAKAGTVRELVDVATEQNPLIDEGWDGITLGYAAAALLYVDDLKYAEAAMDRALDAARSRGAPLAASIAHHFRAWVALHRGRLDQAVADADLSLQTYLDGWAPAPWSAHALAKAHVERGDLDAAAEAIAHGGRGDPDRPEQALLLEARAALELARNRPARALEDAYASGRHVESKYGLVPSRVFSWRPLAALAAHRLGRKAEARAIIEPGVAELRPIGPARQLGAHLSAAAAVTGGAAGLELHREAVEVLQQSPAELDYAHTLLAQGAALRRYGNRSAAKGSLFAALEIAERCSALPLAENARAELKALGLRPRRAAQTGAAALTGSERRVADLAATGLTNPQIAHELSVTRKTVESHLAQVYRKLGISSRTKLAAALNR